jgi:hypothetical protein
MKLYVPEIGDELKLKSDWTFTLHAESRNQELALFNNHYIHYYKGYNWIDSEVLEPMRNPDHAPIIYPDYDKLYNEWKKNPMNLLKHSGHFKEHYDKLCKDVRNATEGYTKYWEDNAKWNEDAKSLIKDSITVTIPAGTVLKVDRIYIRKGLSEYSSITFFAKDLGEVTRTNRWSNRTVKKKSLRFWAKLEDCNNIEFE